jgi:hypothetical protein
MAVSKKPRRKARSDASRNPLSRRLIRASRAMTPSAQPTCWQRVLLSARGASRVEPPPGERCGKLSACGEGRRSLSPPVVRPSHGEPPYTPTLRRPRSRLNWECVTGAPDMSSRSIRAPPAKAEGGTTNRFAYSPGDVSRFTLRRFIAEAGAQVSPTLAPDVTACRVPRTDAAGLPRTTLPSR